MTHSKNTTALSHAQVPVTETSDFRVVNPGGERVLQVTPGICVVDALEDSSCLLSEALLFITDYLDEDHGLKTSGVYLLQQHLISAKGILDSSVKGLVTAQRQGGVL